MVHLVQREKSVLLVHLVWTVWKACLVQLVKTD